MRAPGRALVLALVLRGTAAQAAGPLVVNGAGQPLVWDTSAVPWNPDAGALGMLSNSEAVALVGDSFAVWAAVPTASIAYVNAGALADDITAATVQTVVGVCGDGLNPIVFDTDGTITDTLLGAGASNTVLGFAGPECGTFSPPVITEASAILNGKFIDGVADTNNPEVSLAAFAAVFIHEFGHYVGLDHSQINLTEAFDAEPRNDDVVATMFPFLVKHTANLTRDDEVSLSMLYPGASFGTRGRITGRVLRSNGATPFQGAYVIARNVEDPRGDAVGYASGALYFPGNPGGPPAPSLAGAYDLPGLTAGASYTVEIEPIYVGFTGGSGVGPFSVPVALPGPPEFWSGDSESGHEPPDDPTAPGVPIAVAAGATTAGIDVVINGVAAPANDACGAATSVGALPFTTSVATDGATTAADDPAQRCGARDTPQNANSVWYRLTAPGDGTLIASTAGSNYDTVLAAYTGACGRLGPVACNDDDGGSIQSTIVFPVSAGTNYLLEVTNFGGPGGGTLHVSVDFTPAMPASCTATAPGTCIPGHGGTALDCAAEWLVEPVPAVERATIAKKNVPNTRLVCVDGDPSCDFDGVTAKNGSCQFHVAVCINNEDPRPAAKGCVPSAVTSYVLQSPNAVRPRDGFDRQNAARLHAAVAALASPGGATSGKSVAFAPAATALNRCSPFQSIVLPVGLRTLRGKAVVAPRKTDTDQLRLQCLR
jgi:hypothetical protein